MGQYLITGGAGFIGCNLARFLLAKGHAVTVLDNFATGHRAAVDARVQLVEGSILDAACLADLFSRHDIDTVMHFAAHTIVPESVADPLKYYRNNGKFQVRHHVH